MRKTFEENPTKLSKSLNHLAVGILAKLGNKNPNQSQINLMTSFLSEISIQQLLTFDHRLTHREISCLLLAAKGWTAEETAELLNVKSTTITTFRNNIMRKLGCKTMTHAVYKGMQRGYIQFESAQKQLELEEVNHDND